MAKNVSGAKRPAAAPDFVLFRRGKSLWCGKQVSGVGKAPGDCTPRRYARCERASASGNSYRFQPIQTHRGGKTEAQVRARRPAVRDYPPEIAVKQVQKSQDFPEVAKLKLRIIRVNWGSFLRMMEARKYFNTASKLRMKPAVISNLPQNFYTARKSTIPTDSNRF